MDDWWGGFQGEAGARQRALLLPRLFFQHFANSSYLVERVDRRLVAFLIGFLSQSRPDEAYIHFVGVDPVLRRVGLAAALYRRFFEHAKQRGARSVAAITSPGKRNIARVPHRARISARTQRHEGRWHSGAARLRRSRPGPYRLRTRPRNRTEISAGMIAVRRAAVPFAASPSMIAGDQDGRWNSRALEARALHRRATHRSRLDAAVLFSVLA
jgi:GNAT superfamily N-acetyltransferase